MMKRTSRAGNDSNSNSEL